MDFLLQSPVYSSTVAAVPEKIPGRLLVGSGPRVRTGDQEEEGIEAAEPPAMTAGARP
jgi:hypothetical protein